MLNKELLVVDARKAYPYTHLVKVSSCSNGEVIGHVPVYMWGTSAISPSELPMNGYKGHIVAIYTSSDFKTYLEIFPNGAPRTLFYLGRSDSGEYYGVGGNKHWDDGDVNLVEWSHIMFTEDDIGKHIPIWLSSNPPHTNKKVKTVFTRSRKEGVVNAEQGNASSFYTKRTRSRDHSRDLSQERRSRGCADVLQLYGLRFDNLCPIVSSSSPKENCDVLYYPSKEYRGVVHWRNKRSRRYNSNSFGCRNSDRHGSRCPSTYSGQLHNQWIRVHVLNEKEALYV